MLAENNTTIFVLLLFAIYTYSVVGYVTNSNKIMNSRNRHIVYAGGQVPMVPFYPYPGSRDYQWMDIYNALGRKRTLFVGRFLDDEACNQLIASLIWLQSQDEKSPITLYINVPGSMIKPAFAVYDVMRRMKCPLITINTGLTVGMGALLCAVGTPGQRFALPNARFLMARTGLEDGIQGQAVELQLAVREVMNDNEVYISEIAKLSGQPKIKVTNEMQRDFYLTAPEACAYGIIDKIMAPTQAIKVKKFRGEDDDVIYYGHFSESRKVKSGPDDKVVQYTADGQDFDEYTAEQTKKKINSRDPRASKDPNVRFANSRLKPPGINKLKPKEPKAPGKDGENPFKNTGW